MKKKDISEVLRHTENKLHSDDIRSMTSAARKHDRNIKRSALTGALVLTVGFAGLNTSPTQSPASAATFAPVSVYLDSDQRPIITKSDIEEMFSAGSSSTEIAEAFSRQVLRLEIAESETIPAPANYEYVRVRTDSGEIIEAHFFVGGELGTAKLLIPRMLFAANAGYLTNFHQDELNVMQSFSQLQNTMVKRLQAPLTTCPVTSVSLNKWDSDGVKRLSSDRVKTNGYRTVSLQYKIDRPSVGIALAECDGSFIAAQPVALLSPGTVIDEASIAVGGTVTVLSPEETLSIKNYHESFYRKFVPNNVNSSLTDAPGVSVALYSGNNQLSPMARCIQFKKEQNATNQTTLADSRVVCALQADGISQVVMEIRQGLVLELTNIWAENSEFKVSPQRWDAMTSQIQVKEKM
jgi:hypothetical protein